MIVHRKTPAMVSALPISSSLWIQEVISSFTTTLALETQWRLQPQVFAIKLPGIKVNLPKVSLPQLGGKNETQKKNTKPVYVDENPNAGLFTNPKNTTKTATTTKTSGTGTAPPKEGVRVRAAGSPASSTQAPTLEELRQKKGLELNPTYDQGWKRFPSRRRPGVDMEGFLNMAKDINSRS
eukprot:jgi/Galph1/2399/GphlegSOOS_G1031.1